MRLFVDTSAFLALEDKDDQNHKSAMEFRDGIRAGRTSFRIMYTTNYILDEAITLIRFRLGYSAAVSFRETVNSSGIINTLWILREFDSDPWEIFKKYRDKDFSYTDCTSFAIMKREDIDTVFTYDEHFSQFGFKCVP